MKAEARKNICCIWI